MQMDLSQLLEDYLLKIPTKDLQIKYNLRWEKLTKILKENNVYKKNNSLYYSIDKDTFIKNNYFTMSNKDIAYQIKIQEDGVRVAAKRLGFPLKGSGWKYNESITNLNYNSNEFFYFLGWMAADGNISKNFHNITLALIDLEIVERFKKLFPTARLYYSYKQRQKDLHCLHIGSKELALYLNSVGITPNKTKTLNVSETLWNHHFVRGFFEGDGHVRKTGVKDKHTRYSIGFVCASEIFIIRLNKFLFDNGIIGRISKEKTFFRLHIEGKEKVKLFYNLIYKDCEDWFLGRKKQILDQLFSNE